MTVIVIWIASDMKLLMSMFFILPFIFLSRLSDTCYNGLPGGVERRAGANAPVKGIPSMQTIGSSAQKTKNLSR